MDRQLNQHYQASLEVRVIDITDHDQVASGKIVDISQSGVHANLSLRFEAGASVRVQLGDCELFGRVTYCAEGRSFRTGIEVQRVVIGESDLSRLVNTVLADTMPTTPGVKVNA